MKVFKTRNEALKYIFLNLPLSKVDTARDEIMKYSLTKHNDEIIIVDPFDTLK